MLVYVAVMKKPDFDIIIVGGGLVGTTLALAVEQAGFKTLVIDAAPEPEGLAPTFDGRASAIAFASMRMLDVLGVKSRLSGQMEPIRHILVSDSKVSAGSKTHTPSPLTLHFNPQELDEDTPLGFLVENRHMRFAQRGEAKTRKNLTCLFGQKVIRRDVDGPVTTITTDTGDTHNASLVIACDGKASPLRAAAGIRTTGWMYDQKAIVTTVVCEKPHGGIAHELFLPSGPFAILPLTDNRANIVWTERPRAADAAAKLDDDLFASELQRRFGDFLGRVTPVTPRWVYPLGLQIASDYTAERLALCGDSAHAIHPIAGQGFNMGLRDVAALAEVLAEARLEGRDIGDAMTLSRYEGWRRGDNTLLAASTDVFNRLFSNSHTSVRMARDLGMGVVNAIGPARRFFMREAGGDVGDLPRLLRGQSL